MTTRKQTSVGAAFAAALLLTAVISATVGRIKGLEGFILGTAGSAFNLWALWAIIGVASRSAAAGQPPRRGTFVIVLAFLVKLPVFIALGLLANRIGGAAPTCFLAGIGLVYSALVGWALAQR